MAEKRRKTATLNLRISPALKDAAERAAEADQRSVTSLIEKVLTDHLRASGHLPSGDAEAASAIIDGLEKGRKRAESGE